MGIQEIHARLNDDLEFFAAQAPLVIKDDQGQLVPFKLNTAQRYTHARLEEQRKKKGWVRALVLKGRQQGMSTYINARFYHRTTRSTGQSVFILSHEGKTTDKLFDMVARFQENVHPAIKPQEGKRNTRQITFPGLHADYSAGTAGNEHVGRGGTAQFFHGSEAAYWERAYEIQDGALKSIRLAPGTEIILESTANGPSGLFHEKCMAALRHEGDYILVFVPWFWEDDYERDDDGSPLTAEEEQFVETYLSKPFPFQGAAISAGKAKRKLLWRRAEIFDLSPRNPEVGAAKFRSIYPSNPVEAFLSTGVGEVRAGAIVTARSLDQKLELDSMMPRIGGLDPAGGGKKADRSILSVRQGRVLEKIYRSARREPMELVGWAARLLDREALDMLFVDNGYGVALVDRLHELGFKRRVIGVWFGQGADEPNKYTNKRSEILSLAADWINAGGVSVPDGPEVQIDEKTWLCGGDEVHADFASLPMHRETSDAKHQFPSKEEIIKIFGRSPDIFDATALTFAFPVVAPSVSRENQWRRAGSSDTIGSVTKSSRGGLRSMARKRELR